MEQKESLLKLVTEYTAQLKKSYSDELNNMKYFKTFCYYSPTDGKAHLCDEIFDGFFNNFFTKNNSSEPDLDNLLKGTFDRKTLIRALNLVVGDKRVAFEISNALLNHKNLNKVTYETPKNGTEFLNLLQKLDYELGMVDKNKKLNIFEKATKKSNINNIIKLLKNAILKEFQIINISINYLNQALNIFEEMASLLQEDKYFKFTGDKKRCIYEFLSLSNEEKDSINKILDYNKKLRTDVINNGEYFERLDKPEYKHILEKMISDMEVRANTFNEYFFHINNIHDCNNASLLQNSLRNSKKDHAIGKDVYYIIGSMIKEDFSLEIFSNGIMDTIGMVTPKTKRIIKKPEKLDDILEIFDCYDEILSNESGSSLKVRKVQIILDEIISEITDVYNKSVVTNEKINISLAELKNIYSSLVKKKKITLINEEAYVESALAIEDDDEEEMRFYVLAQLRSIREYNKLCELKRLMQNARRKRSDVYNKLAEKDLESASKLLEEKINNVKNKKELLVVLEHVFDKGIESYSGDDRSYYESLCCLALDCTHYMNKNAGIMYLDGEELREELAKYNM